MVSTSSRCRERIPTRPHPVRRGMTTSAARSISSRGEQTDVTSTNNGEIAGNAAERDGGSSQGARTRSGQLGAELLGTARADGGPASHLAAEPGAATASETGQA